MSRTLEGKTLLVTGAAGFIGSHLVNRLRQVPGARLVLLSRRPVAPARQAGEIWLTADLRSLQPSTWRAAGVEQIDYVFHLGAFTPKTATQANDVDRILSDNLQGTQALLQSLPAQPERLILASTLDVYGPPGADTILTEESPCNPVGLYGTSKLFCEQMVPAHARAHAYGVAILRYGHIFGPGEAAYAKLIPETIRQLLKGKSPTVYGDGGAERDFLHVDDAIEATLRAATSGLPLLGPVNIVRGESHPIRHIVQTLADAAGFPGRITYLHDKPRGHSLRFHNGRMHDLLGQWTLVPLEQGLEAEVCSFRRAA